MLAELADVLARSKFNVKTSQIDRYLVNLAKKSKTVTLGAHLEIVSEDPDDDIVLCTAFKGKADYLVTGDKHLLTLEEYKRAKDSDSQRNARNLGKRKQNFLD
jgi:putative PIN family toxin of toxin-antitoxin system